MMNHFFTKYSDSINRDKQLNKTYHKLEQKIERLLN